MSWIYDADFERLADRSWRLVVSGDRADDLALRCVLAGLAPQTVDADLVRALDAALAATPPGGRIEVIATYTAMLAIRALLAARTGARPYWDATDEEAPR